MGVWNRKKVDSSSINSGNEYDLNSQVSLESLNAIINSGLYSQDTVEKMGNLGDYSSGTTYRYPNIVRYAEDGCGYMAIYKDGNDYESFSGIVPTNSIYWKKIVDKGDKGEQGIQGIQGIGLSSIEKTATTGLLDTYTITFTDDSTTTFDVTNGNGIVGIEKTGTAENVDTYTVTFTDGTSTTFEVVNSLTEEQQEKLSKIVTDGDGKKALLNNGEYGEVGTVDTVNNVLPDENKNITITADDINYDEESSVKEKLDNLEDEKVDVEYINELLNLKNFIIEIGGFTDGSPINLRLEEGTDKNTRIYWGDGSVEDITDWGLKNHTYPTGTAASKIIIKSLDGTSANMPKLYSNVGSATIITGCRLPSITTTIGDYSFFSSGLIDIDIPHNITTIGANAFYASNFRKIELGRNIISIGNNAFKWCDDLEYVKVFALTPPTLGTDAFTTLENENEYPIYVPKESLTAYKEAWSAYADRIYPIPDGKWITEDLAQIATAQSYTATLSSSGWTGSSAPYSKEITVSGILATDKPDFDLNLTSTAYANIPTIQSAWFNVYRAVAGAGKITFYSHEIPSIDIPLLIKVVR